MRTNNMMQSWKQGDQPKKRSVGQMFTKAHFCLSLLQQVHLQPFPSSPTSQTDVFLEALEGPQIQAILEREKGVSSKPWSAHREGSARHNNFLCAEEDQSPAPCWPLAGKSDTGRGFPPGESQLWQFKAMCVLINFFKQTGLSKTEFLSTHVGNL